MTEARQSSICSRIDYIDKIYMYHNRIDQTSKWHPISISVLFFYNLITYTQHQSPNSIILGTRKPPEK